MAEFEEKEPEFKLSLPKSPQRVSLNTGLVGIARNYKFLGLFKPTLNVYRTSLKQISSLRKKYKKINPKRFYSEKNAILDATHVKAAPQIKNLLEKMGGLYNKAAQDFVTRGMIVPPILVT